MQFFVLKALSEGQPTNRENTSVSNTLSTPVGANQAGSFVQIP